MNELPKGWARATVNDLIAPEGLFVDGDWVESKDQDPDGDVRLTQLADVGEGHWRNRSDRYLTAATAHRLGCSYIEVDDVLVARMPDPLGRACVFPGDSRPCVTVVDVAILRPGPGSVRPRWLMWAVNSPGIRAAIEAQQAGTTRKRISRKNLGQVELSVPPLAEQERIVAAIEEAFSKLDAGEAGLRTVRQLLKRMRDAIVTSAVTGRLIPQDPTDTPAAKLLADLGIEEINPPGAPQLPTGWCWVELGESAYDSGYGTSAKCSYNADGAGVLRIPNIRGGRIDLTDLKRAPSRAKLDDSLFLAPGDLLIIRTNGSRDLIGRCAAVTSNLGCSFASYLIRFRLRTDLLSGSFASLQLSAQWWRRRLESMAPSSAGQYNLSLRGLSPLPIAVPPLAEQGRIIAEVERQLSFVEACERAVDTGLARSAGLRRSVLKAAFEGRLVPQDPSDEPASVLLARIRTERQNNPTPQRRSRRTA